MNPNNDLIRARGYIIDKLPGYGYDLAKSQSRVYLALGNLEQAISWTRTALYIMRIQKHTG